MIDENRIEQPDGSVLIAVDVTSRTNVDFICPQCAAWQTKYCSAISAKTISCMAYDRTDNRSIYWVRENRPDPNPL